MFELLNGLGSGHGFLIAPSGGQMYSGTLTLRVTAGPDVDIVLRTAATDLYLMAGYSIPETPSRLYGKSSNKTPFLTGITLPGIHARLKISELNEAGP